MIASRDRFRCAWCGRPMGLVGAEAEVSFGDQPGLNLHERCRGVVLATCERRFLLDGPFDARPSLHFQTEEAGA